MELVDLRDRAYEDLSDLCEIPNRVGNGHIRGRILSLGIVPAGIQPRVDAALHIGGQGITDDNSLLGVKIGDGGGYPVEKPLFGFISGPSWVSTPASFAKLNTGTLTAT